MDDNRMSFEEFVEAVKDNIRDYLPEKYRDAEISTEPFQKLNSSYMGLQVKTEGQNVVPTVNLESHYGFYNATRPSLTAFDSILRKIADLVQSDPGLEVDWVKDYSQVKDRLFIRVNDAKENAFSLRNMPHQEVDGLAVTYHIAYEGRQGIEASIPVTNDLLKTYGIDAQQLHADAVKSGEAVNPPLFISMAEMMSRMTGIDADEIAPSIPGGPDLMILTNDQALYGAGSLFYPGLMDTVASQVGGNYFILPSSVHETIILPDDGMMDRDALEGMVREINEMVVAPEDRLSDYVYHYDAQDHVLEKAETYSLRMAQKELAAEKAETAHEAATEAVPSSEDKKDIPGKPLPAQDERKGDGHKEARDDKASSGRDGHRRENADREKKHEPQKKERKSVLTRLSEKKEKMNSGPKKDAPARSKSTELG